MKLETAQSLIALGIALQLGLSSAAAASPAIGTVVARGSFRLNNATVTGNASLLEGTLLETARDSSSVELNSGARFVVAPASRGRVFGDHIVLEKGESRLENGAGFHLEAQGLKIQPETGASAGRVSFSGGNKVQVAAFRGSFRVLNSRGVLVANIGTGRALEFEPQLAGGGSATRVTGCLQNRGVRMLVTDETSLVTMEVAGAGLDKEMGNRVELTGTLDPAATPLAEASQFIRVTKVQRLGKGCPATGGAAAAGKTGKANGSGKGGISSTAIAIIGGVAVAATIGGLAAAEQLPGQNSDTPISR